MPFRFYFRLRRNPASTQSIPEEETTPPFSCGDDFLASLPKVRPTSLPEDDRTCAICQDKYGERPDSENAVKLPCGHHMGASCVENWFSPDGSNKNTCPLCREMFFELEDEEDIEPTFTDLLTSEEPNFNAAFDAVFPLLQDFQNVQENNVLSMTGAAQRPVYEQDFFRAPPERPILISALVGMLFEVFARDTAAVPWQDTTEIQIMLGQVAECFETAKVDLPWGVRGPQIEQLRDPNSIGDITTALQQLLRYEERWYQNELRAIERRQSTRRRGWSFLGF